MELSPLTNILRGDHVTNLIEHADDAMWDVDALCVAYARYIDLSIKSQNMLDNEYMR